MKTKAFLLLAGLAAVACNQNKPAATAADAEDDSTAVAVADSTPAIPLIEYNTTDALMFGLKGKVERVLTDGYKMVKSETDLSEGEMMYRRIISFDQWGHVTQDEWNNEYGYDADGNYYRGNHVYTKVKRDKSGRIVQYIDEEPATDNEDNRTYTFAYDKKGRLKKIDSGGWTGGFEEQRTYEGDKLYPSKASSSEYYEGGGGAEVEDAYTYRHVDEKGNWTERLCIRTITEEDEGYYDEETETMHPSTTITEEILLERRVIIYYDED